MRRLLLLAALAALTVGASACDTSPPAATVAGSTVTRSELDSQLSEISQSPYAQCALQVEGINIAQLTGVGDHTVTSQLASYVLSSMVLERLAESELDRRGHPITSADLDAARADLVSELQGASTCPDQVAGQELESRLPADFLDQQVRFLAAEESLASLLGHVDVSDSALRAYYESHQSQFQELCLSDIAVESQQEAQSIHDAIASGATSFAAEAQQSSIDTQTAAQGGKLDCLPSSQIANKLILGAVSNLAPGQLSAPVFEPGTGPGGGGVWFLLRLDDRTVLPYSQASSQIRQTLLDAQTSKVGDEFSRLTKEAKVNVDPRYGSWSGSQGIRPPQPPPADDLLSRTADQPVSNSASAAG